MSSIENKTLSLGASLSFLLSSIFIISYKYIQYAEQEKKTKAIEYLSEYPKDYFGSCHCRKVFFYFTAPRHLVVWKCNCSICNMKKNYHVVVPAENFKLKCSEDELTTYQFNEKVAVHKFCKTCGVQAFYHPRSNPDGIAVTFACIEAPYIESYEEKEFDGQNWEEFIDKSDIQKHSKAKE